VIVEPLLVYIVQLDYKEEHVVQIKQMLDAKRLLLNLLKN
jgi:hypothetical protein